MFALLVYLITAGSAAVLLIGVIARKRAAAGRDREGRAGGAGRQGLGTVLETAEFVFLVSASISVILLLGFEFFLVLATLLSGLAWWLDYAVLAKRRRAAAGGAEPAPEPAYVEYSKSFFPVLLFVLLLRSFLVEPFRIPSGSMLPTLEVGDFILVNKFSYGLRLPVVHTRFLSLGDPQRGDIAVFRYPEDPSMNYIKRVIGVPGDRIRYIDKELYLNGERVPREFLRPYGAGDSYLRRHPVAVYEEHLPGREHLILIDPQRHGRDEPELVVPEGMYYVMGDNRDDSRDSRVWGFLPEENLVGKAFFIWMHIDFGGEGLDLGRIGEQIR